jgi:hypothetical protein
MVYIIDEGSTFDAPLDRIWKYLSSSEHRHPSSNVINREVNGNVVELTTERNMNGQPIRFKIRNTLYPPFGMVQEFLEGPMTGSKAFLYYIPKGEKTGVTLVGDYKVQGMDESATRDRVLAQAQVSFDEDNANLKRM